MKKDEKLLFYETLLESIARVVYRLNFVTGRFEFISDAATELFGLDVESVCDAGLALLGHHMLPGDLEAVMARISEVAAGGEIMKACVDAGGALSGEHGIGAEKRMFMPWLYNETDIENMERVRLVFGNAGQFNPCKLLPTGTGCGEMAHQAAAIRAAGPDAYV